MNFSIELGSVPRTDSAFPALYGFEELRCPITGVRIRRSPQWTDIALTGEYRVTFELIDDNILSAFPQGRISHAGTIALFDNYTRFLEYVGLRGKSYIEISDYSRITNIPSKRTRLKVFTCLMEKVSENSLIGHFVYNVPKHIRWLYNIGTKLKQVSIPMIAFDTYAEAVGASLALLRQQRPAVSTQSFWRKLIERLRYRGRLERYADEILRYMGSINWDEPGTQFEGVSADHPFKAVFDALTVVKTDVENSFAELRKTQSSLLEASRTAGMAEVATGVLHNVGNVLNSVNVSCTLLMDQLRESRVGNLAKVAELIHQAEVGQAIVGQAGGDLAHFFTRDPRGQQVPSYLISLAAALNEERQVMMREAQSLRDRIEHVKEIVSMQQNFGRVSGVYETIAPERLMEDALKLHSGSLTRHGIAVMRQFEAVPPITVDKHSVLQILLNLINNAKYACAEGGSDRKTITLSLAMKGTDRVRMQVADNGIGIQPEHMARLFQHGFTTRKNGHGFGLHSGALAAREMGGSLTVHSDGPGTGAAFCLELPCQPGEKP